MALRLELNSLINILNSLAEFVFTVGKDNNFH